MWTRAATQARSEALVNAYNATHKNQIAMTVVPTDDYQGEGRRGGRRERPSGPVLGGRGVHAELDVGRACSRTSLDRIDAMPYLGEHRARSPSRLDLGGQEVRPARS